MPLFFLSHWFIVVFSGRQRRRGRGDGAPFPPFVLRAVRASGALASPGLVSLFSWPRCRDMRSLLSPPCPTRGQLRIHLSPERSGLLQHAPQAGSWMARSEPGNQCSPAPCPPPPPRPPAAPPAAGPQGLFSGLIRASRHLPQNRTSPSPPGRLWPSQSAELLSPESFGLTAMMSSP